MRIFASVTAWARLRRDDGALFDDYGGRFSAQAPKKPDRGVTPLDDYGGGIPDQAPKKPNSGVTPPA